MENNPNPKGLSDAELFDRCYQFIKEQIAILKASESKIADEGNCYFSATGAEHGRELRGNFQSGAKNGK